MKAGDVRFSTGVQAELRHKARVEEILTMMNTDTGEEQAWELAYDHLKIKWLTHEMKFGDAHLEQEMHAHPLLAEAIVLTDAESELLNRFVRRIVEYIVKRESPSMPHAEADLPGVFQQVTDIYFPDSRPEFTPRPTEPGTRGR